MPLFLENLLLIVVDIDWAEEKFTSLLKSSLELTFQWRFTLFRLHSHILKRSLLIASSGFGPLLIGDEYPSLAPLYDERTWLGVYTDVPNISNDGQLDIEGFSNGASASTIHSASAASTSTSHHWQDRQGDEAGNAGLR